MFALLCFRLLSVFWDLLLEVILACSAISLLFCRKAHYFVQVRGKSCILCSSLPVQDCFQSRFTTPKANHSTDLTSALNWCVLSVKFWVLTLSIPVLLWSARMGLLIGNGVLKFSHKIEPNINSSNFTLFICRVNYRICSFFFFFGEETGVRKEHWNKVLFLLCLTPWDKEKNKKENLK